MSKSLGAYAVSLTLTCEEAQLLARLVGHHVTGRGLERAYEELIDKLDRWCGVDYRNLQPLPAATSQLYGDRPLVDAGD